MIKYITGSSGFIGKALLQQVEATPIFHKAIATSKLVPFDAFFFLSGYGNMTTHTDHEAIMQANVSDLIHILNEAVQHPFKSFVFISTSSVKLRTQTMYSRSKRAAEEVLLSYMERFNKPICIIRPYTVYGPNDNPAHLIPTLLRSIYKGELVNFVTSATHDYVFIDDVVKCILNLSEHSARGFYEAGTGITLTNTQILELLETITGKKANINKVTGLRSYDNDNWVSTNFRSRGYGWSPQVQIKEGLERVVEDYKKNPDKYDK